MTKQMRIVVLRSGAVGDCILSTPALAALRRHYPSAHITLVGDPFSAGVFQNSPDIDRVIAMDSKQMSTGAYLAELLKLRLERFNLLLDLHGNGRSFVQTLLIGGGRRIGFGIRSSRSTVYTDKVPYRTDVHTVVRQAEILNPLGIELTDLDRSLRLCLFPEEREDAREMLAAAGLPRGQAYVTVHPSAGAGKLLKQWIPERFAELSDRIQEDLGLPVVLTGQGAEEAPVVDRILSSVKRPVINLFGRTHLRALCAVVEGAALYAGCDTGPMHLAAAVGTPVVALFGPTDPNRWHPWSSAPYRLLRAGLECSPCAGKTCPYDVLCMRSLEVEAAFSAVREVCRENSRAIRQPLPL